MRETPAGEPAGVCIRDDQDSVPLVGPGRQGWREGNHQAGHVGCEVKIRRSPMEIIEDPRNTADRIIEGGPRPGQEAGEVRLRSGIALGNMHEARSSTRQGPDRGKVRSGLSSICLLYTSPSPRDRG